jgi:hypothetical protein
MRTTNFALMAGLVGLALYGCGDSGSSKKNDAATTSTNTSTTTATGTPTSTATQTSTSTQADASVKLDTAPSAVDGGVKADTALPTIDAAVGVDTGTVSPAVDGSAGGLDSGAGQDGAAVIDVGAKLDVAASVDGATAVDTASPGDAPLTTDGTSAGTCDYPQCYIDLVKPCAPEGACIQQTSISTSGVSSNLCYANGVKVLTTTDLSIITAPTTVVTVKNAGGLCYTMEAPYSLTSTTVTYTMKNAAGVTVATLAADPLTNTTTITCVGGTPVVVSSDCDEPGADAGSGGATCTEGTCVP